MTPPLHIILRSPGSSCTDRQGTRFDSVLLFPLQRIKLNLDRDRTGFLRKPDFNSFLWNRPDTAELLCPARSQGPEELCPGQVSPGSLLYSICARTCTYTCGPRAALRRASFRRRRLRAGRRPPAPHQQVADGADCAACRAHSGRLHFRRGAWASVPARIRPGATNVPDRAGEEVA